MVVQDPERLLAPAMQEVNCRCGVKTSGASAEQNGGGLGGRIGREVSRVQILCTVAVGAVGSQRVSVDGWTMKSRQR